MIGTQRHMPVVAAVRPRNLVALALAVSGLRRAIRWVEVVAQAKVWTGRTSHFAPPSERWGPAGLTHAGARSPRARHARSPRGGAHRPGPGSQRDVHPLRHAGLPEGVPRRCHASPPHHARARFAATAPHDARCFARLAASGLRSTHGASLAAASAGVDDARRGPWRPDRTPSRTEWLRRRSTWRVSVDPPTIQRRADR